MNLKADAHISVPGGDEGQRGGRMRAALVVLVGISLVVRIVVWIPVAMSEMPPIHDEGSYLTRAVGYGGIVEAWCSGRAAAEEDWFWSYRDGTWPPLHSALIGLAFALFGPSLWLARLAVVLQSAATTGVVAALTNRMANRRAAIAAGLIHALYPSFVSYSHLLWSETTYALMLVCMLYFAVRTVDARGKRQVWFALLAGGFLGLAGLTRAAILPLLFAAPAWLVWRMRGPRRFLLPAAAIATSAVVMTPWLWQLYSEEQRFVPLSTAAGYNLYLGNNPWSLEDQSRREAVEALQAYEDEHGLGRDEAARQLALRNIRDDIPGFVRRCWAHARAMCVPDWYALRHVFYAHYYPAPPFVAIGLLALFFVSFAAFAAACVCGATAGRDALSHRSALLACLIFGVLPNFLTIANSRMLVPLLVVMTPLAGIGAAERVVRRRWLRAAGAIVLAAVIVRLLNPSLPIAAFGTRNQVSMYYSSVAKVLQSCFGANTINGKDRILVRYAGGGRAAYRFQLVSEGHAFGDTDERATDWRPAPKGEEGRLEITSEKAAAGRPVLRVTNAVTAQTVDLVITAPEAWREWTPTGVKGLDYMWLGAAGISDEQATLLLGKDED